MTKISNDVMGYKVVANNEVKMFNNVDDVVDYVVMMFKKHPNNAVYVNGFRLTLERTKDYKWSVVLVDADKEWVAGYVMGKIKRGLADAVAYCVSRIEINNNMEENNMVDMVNEIDLFNVYVKDMLVNEYNDSVSTAEDFADAYGDTFAEQEYLCGSMEYVYNIRQMWVVWCWKNDVMSRDDAYKYYDSNRDMFICEDDLDDIVEGFDGTEDVGDGSCLLWAKNPYYVEQEQVENSSPCLNDVERVVKIIEDYIKGYNGYSASICVPWDVFDEDDMKMLIEDGVFEACVVGVLMQRDIKDVLVYDDGVYVSVDANMFDKVA